jgi:hypothetical protein
MRTIVAPRASAILFDILRSQPTPGPFMLPANICPIVPMTFLKAGVPFEFVDISADLLGMNLDQVESLLSSRRGGWGGILYAHTFGDPTTPEDFFVAAKRQWPNLLIIDDRCLCTPEFEPVRGTAADAVLYSTGYAKIVDIGYGGYAFLREDAEWEHHPLPFSREALQAMEVEYKDCVSRRRPYVYADSAWLQMDSDLPTWNEYAGLLREAALATTRHRQSINAVYNSLIPPELALPTRFQLWRFNLRLGDPTAVLRAIFSAGLFASSHYASLVGIMGRGDGDHAHELATHILNLFNDEHYTMDMAEQTARIIMRSPNIHAG